MCDSGTNRFGLESVTSFNQSIHHCIILVGSVIKHIWPTSAILRLTFETISKKKRKTIKGLPLALSFHIPKSLSTQELKGPQMLNGPTTWGCDQCFWPQDSLTLKGCDIYFFTTQVMVEIRGNASVSQTDLVGDNITWHGWLIDPSHNLTPFQMSSDQRPAMSYYSVQDEYQTQNISSYHLHQPEWHQLSYP